MLLPEQIPASVIAETTFDPAGHIPGVPPNFGGQFLPHISTIVGRNNFASQAYSNYSDEALFHSFQNAEIMRNEPMIMECIEARMRAPALCAYHIRPMDDSDMLGEEKDRVEETMQRTYRGMNNRWGADDLARKLTVILNHTPNFMMFRYNLMNSIWYGRYMVQSIFRPKLIGGRYVPHIARWEPRHGDKLVFRWDDGDLSHQQGQVGIRIGWSNNALRDTWNDIFGGTHDHIDSNEHGLVYWLNPVQRQTCSIHKHIIEDGDFNFPLKAGSINGIGIRTRIYWTWWAYQECLRLMLEYIERSALGIEVWRFPAHNREAENRTREAAKNRGAPGRHILLFPVPAGENADLYDVQIIEPGLAGLQELQNILQQFFGWKIKRYILGQTLSSEAGATGMGSGVADAHLATLSDIIKFDAINLEETLTFDLLPVLQKYGFAHSEDIFLKFVVDTESANSQDKLAALQVAYSMGLDIKPDDIYRILGLSRPSGKEHALKRPDPLSFVPGTPGGM